MRFGFKHHIIMSYYCETNKRNPRYYMFDQRQIYRDYLGYRSYSQQFSEDIPYDCDQSKFNFNTIKVNAWIALEIEKKRTIHEIVSTCICHQQSQKVTIQIQRKGKFRDICLICFPQVVIAKPEIFKDWSFNANYIQRIQPYQSRKPIYSWSKHCKWCEKGDCEGTLKGNCHKYIWKESSAYIRIRADFVDALNRLFQSLTKEDTVAVLPC